MFDIYIIPTAEATVTTLMQSINKVIINPLIIFMFACAMVYFLYGLSQYILSPGNEEVHKKSKSIMLWGVIGLFIMTAVFAIMRIILNTVGETKIKINDNGDYIVEKIDIDNQGNITSTDSGTLENRDVADNQNTGSSVTNGNIKDAIKEVDTDKAFKAKDISIDENVANLPLSTYTKSPFPEYSTNPLCYNDYIPGKGSTEFEALKIARKKAQNDFVKAGGILKKDKLGNLEEVPVFESKVLYHKSSKTYYAWLNVRDYVKGGKSPDCNLKIIKPAPEIPSSIITTQTNSINDTNTPDLTLAELTTSPFPKYEQNPLCWSEPFYNKEIANNEFDALKFARATIRKEYLADPSVPALDKKNLSYPSVFASKVLYDKANNRYYAWLDSRAPIGTGKMSDCNLKILEPAPVLPGSVVTSETELSVPLEVPVLPAADFLKSPFATYDTSPLCWTNNSTPFHFRADSEFNALEGVNIKARQEYLKANNISPTDNTKANFPEKFEVMVLYEKAANKYHAWLDARAPIGTGTLSDCAKLKILTPAREIPKSVIFNEFDLSTPTAKSTTTDFTLSPFPVRYAQSPFCWREELHGDGSTEFKALEKLRLTARKLYLQNNNLIDEDTSPTLPVKYGIITLYDKSTKTYHVWWDVRGPKNGGRLDDCNKLVVTGVDLGLPAPSERSGKPNPLSSYISDSNFYRVVDSGSSLSYTSARSIAINNALIQIAELLGLTDINLIPSKRILEERYYDRDTWTNKYDYWVAIEAPK